MLNCGFAGTRTKLNQTRCSETVIACQRHNLRATGFSFGAGTMKEMWKRFAADNYEVSNGGIIRRATPGRGTWAGRELKPVKATIGYFVVAPTLE